MLYKHFIKLLGLQEVNISKIESDKKTSGTQSGVYRKLSPIIYRYTMKSKYISGIVMTDSVCDIIVIDAPVLVSPPYAAG